MSGKKIIDTYALLALNPEFAQALFKGEPWALQHMRICECLNTGEPEGFRRQFDGKPRKWCGGACTSPEGCISCALPENHEMARSNRQTRNPREFAREGIIIISGNVGDALVTQVQELLEIATNHRRSEIEVRIESNGGDVRCALEIYDLICDAPVTKRVGVVGYEARSGGALILQACDQREATPEAHILIHHMRFTEVTLDTLKNAEAVNRIVASCEPQERRINKILMSRTKRTLREIEHVCRQDTDMTSTEALKFGLIDKIRAVTKR